MRCSGKCGEQKFYRSQGFLARHIREKQCGHSNQTEEQNAEQKETPVRVVNDDMEEEDQKEFTAIQAPKPGDCDLVCLCKAVYDPDHAMIGCDGCKEWYHLTCLHSEWGRVIWEEEAERMTQFYCNKPGCRDVYEPDVSMSSEELKKWGGKVTGCAKDKNNPMNILYKVSWRDGTKPGWFSEDRVPQECLNLWRAQLAFGRHGGAMWPPSKAQTEQLN